MRPLLTVPYSLISTDQSRSKLLAPFVQYNVIVLEDSHPWNPRSFLPERFLMTPIKLLLTEVVGLSSFNLHGKGC